MIGFSSTPDLADIERDRLRVRRALARPGARLAETSHGYAVRSGGDGRRRAVCVVGPEAFAALCQEGALSPDGQGAWRLARGAAPAEAPCDLAARPGVIGGSRTVMEADGRAVTRAANLGESPLDWLARRRGPDGRPLLTITEHAAGERLRADFHLAGVQARMTVDLTAAPRGASPRGPSEPPGERARRARDRLHGALQAAGPGLREMLERVCLAEASLEAAERALGHPRRAGKTLLKLGLQRVATFYGIG